MEAKDYVAQALRRSGEPLELSCHDPDDPANWPRNMFVWRSNLLGSSGKGHEYFLKHLLGTTNGVLGKDLGAEGGDKPREVTWHEQAPEGKLDLLVTLDFRMSTTCVYSDIVLPTATWYEKNDLNTSDMHPFIHPLSSAVDPAWESRSTGTSTRASPRRSREVAPEVLGVETDVVLTPILHDTAGELAQPFDVKDWKRGEVEPVPGRTMPNVAVVERDYPNLYARFTSIGPLLEKLGNGGKGIGWNTAARDRLPARAERHGGRRTAAEAGNRYRRHRSHPEPRARDQRRSGGEGVGSAEQDDRPRARPPRACRKRTRKSASATSSRSRARSSRRRHGRASRAKRSATTPATPTCTS